AVDVSRLRRRHRLNADGRTAADQHFADADLARLTATGEDFGDLRHSKIHGWHTTSLRRRHAAGLNARRVIVSGHARELHLVARLLGGVFAFPRIQTAGVGGLFVEPSRSPAQEISMTDTAALLAELMQDTDASFVLIARDGAESVELLTGDIEDVELLADIPLAVDGTPREVFAMVPYRQVRERGFDAQDDGTPL